MLVKATILLLAVTTAGINAAHLADFVPRDLNARTANAPGGWSLSQTEAGSCPANNPVCGASWCCPNTLACVHTGHEDIAEVCCPTDTDCSATFTIAPVCADSSWSLWNATFDTADNAGYFCCLQNQVGLQSGACADVGSAQATSGPQAILLAGGTGTSSTAGSSTATKSTTSTTAASQLSTSKSSGTSIITNTATAGSTAATFAPTASVAGTTPAGTSNSVPATTSVVGVTTKGEAVGFNSLGGTYLGGAVIAMFALALL